MAEPLPTVSVIVPVYNAERALPRLIASLRAQDYPRELVEILLVDNRSTDRSAEVVRRYTEVRAHSQTQWKGPAATRNEGIRHARGEVLAFIDADCWADPRWLSAGVRALLASGADRVAGRVDFVPSRYPNIYEIYDSTVNFQQAQFVSEGWSGTGNLFARRVLFDEIGLFESALLSHEDSEFGLRATRAGKTLAYAREAVVRHETRRTLGALVKKWLRTEYGAAQVYRRCGLLELHLWKKKANWRPLWGTWRRFPEPFRANAHLRWTFDLLANLLRLAGNVGNFLGYFSLPGKLR